MKSDSGPLIRFVGNICK